MNPWPRSYTEDVSVVKRAPRKGSAATGECMDLTMDREVTWASTSPTFLTELGHGEVAAAVPPALIWRLSTENSTEDFGIYGKVRRPSSVSLRHSPL
jgi:hypothetical protein